MSQQKSIPQSHIDQFQSLVNRILVHQERYKDHPFPAITILLEQRDLSRDCAQWLMQNKENGISLDAFCEAATLSPKDIVLSKTVQMAFLDEKLSETLVETLVDEGDFLNKHNLLLNYEQRSRTSKRMLAANQLEASRISNRELANLRDCPPYVPMTFKREGNRGQRAIRGLLHPLSVTTEVHRLFADRMSGAIDAETCVTELKSIVDDFRFHTKTIHEHSVSLLSELPLRDNGPLRSLILGGTPPSLTEMSVKTRSLLVSAGIAKKPGEAYVALENIVYGSLENPIYLNNCLASDLIDIIREDFAQDDRDMSDEFVGGLDKLREYTKGFKIMREQGLNMDFVLLRGACEMTAGQAYECVSKGQDASINQLIHGFFKVAVKSREADDYNCVTSLYLMGAILSHDVDTLIKAIGQNDVIAQRLYEASGERRFLNSVQSEAVQEEILSRDLGL